METTARLTTAVNVFVDFVGKNKARLIKLGNLVQNIAGLIFFRFFCKLVIAVIGCSKIMETSPARSTRHLTGFWDIFKSL